MKMLLHLADSFSSKVFVKQVAVFLELFSIEEFTGLLIATENVFLT